MEHVHLLEEDHDDVDQDQTTQAQAEDLQVFPYHVSVKGSMTMKHLQQALSTSAESNPALWPTRRLV